MPTVLKEKKVRQETQPSQPIVEPSLNDFKLPGNDSKMNDIVVYVEPCHALVLSCLVGRTNTFQQISALFNQSYFFCN